MAAPVCYSGGSESNSDIGYPAQDTDDCKTKGKDLGEIELQQAITSDYSLEVIENYRQYFLTTVKREISKEEADYAFSPLFCRFIQTFEGPSIYRFYQLDQSDQIKGAETSILEDPQKMCFLKDQELLQVVKSYIQFKQLEDAYRVASEAIESPAPKSLALLSLVEAYCKGGDCEAARNVAFEIPFKVEAEIALCMVYFQLLATGNQDQDILKQITLIPIRKVIDLFLDKLDQEDLLKESEQLFSSKRLYGYLSDLSLAKIRDKFFKSDQDHEALFNELAKQSITVSSLFMQTVLQEKLEKSQIKKAIAIVGKIQNANVQDYFLLEIVNAEIRLNRMGDVVIIAECIRHQILRNFAFFSIAYVMAKNQEEPSEIPICKKVRGAGMQIYLDTAISTIYLQKMRACIRASKWSAGKKWVMAMRSPVRRAVADQEFVTALKKAKGLWDWFKAFIGFSD